jgi:hypothetical protein
LIELAFNANLSSISAMSRRCDFKFDAKKTSDKIIMQILLFFIQISLVFLEFGNVKYILKLTTVDTYVIRT